MDKAWGKMELDIVSPRPLADVALELERRFDRMITYEDPPYLYPGDMVKDQGGRVIPRGGRVAFQYQAGDSVSQVLLKALEAYERSEGPGFFAVEEGPGGYHVVPRAFRNADGVVEERSSILNLSISLRQEVQNGLQFMEVIASAVSVATDEKVYLGTVPTNALIQHGRAPGIREGKARNLLLGLFQEMGLPLSWHLLNNPGTYEFYLNVHQRTGCGKVGISKRDHG